MNRFTRQFEGFWGYLCGFEGFLTSLIDDSLSWLMTRDNAFGMLATRQMGP